VDLKAGLERDHDHNAGQKVTNADHPKAQLFQKNVWTEEMQAPHIQ
jgi:hypothetical protein